MRLVVLSPGKVREPWLKAGIDEYTRRLGRYCEVNIQLVQDVPDSWPIAKALAEEGKRLLSKIRPSAYVIALTLDGQQPGSVEFSELLGKWFEAGGSEITCVIGGSNGLAQSVLERAQQRLCLSNMTLTHQMTRLFLLEQCYRAFKIMNNEPYHK